VTALKYAGIKITEEMHPSDVSLMNMDTITKPLQHWYEQTVENESNLSSNSVLSFSDVCFSYSAERVVLDNISFKICEGEMTAIVGKKEPAKALYAN
jgi:energy-coupling factor transport system ATP-binding protein